MRARHALALSLFLLSLCGFARADEGMWTLNNLPNAQLKERYGFEPDAVWIDRIMHASARLENGCSGSFVSADGLVLTNHHCVEACVGQVSAANDQDFIEKGFLARQRGEELRCPEIAISRLEEITDVTERLNKVTAGLDGEAFAKAQKAEKAKIASDCVAGQSDTRRCDVVELYHGGQYQLYRYHRFSDVRLAFAPEAGIAFFGGDPDNFMFPRYNLDMGLLRVYEDGKPAKVKDFLKFDPKGAQEGELTLITGHPGSTSRDLTVAQLATTRDLTIQRLLLNQELRGVLLQYSSESPEHAREARTLLFGLENAIKARKGQLNALLDPAVFGFKQHREAELRSYVEDDAQLKAQYGKAWDAIANVQQQRRDLSMRYRMLEIGAGFSSTYFQYARTLVRGAAERGKPNGDRLPEYSDAALPSTEEELLSTAPIFPEFETMYMAWSLTKLREWLGPDDAVVKAVLGDQSPEALAASLVANTQLGDVAQRKTLWAADPATVAASNDPMILLAIRVDEAARAVRAQMENEVEAVETKNAELIAKARFAKYGTTVYPDATFTLRLSYGQVKGWNEAGKDVTPFTTIAGVYTRATGADPFRLPQSWLDRKSKINLDQRFDFVTTNDIIGGNSGSPMINRKGDIIGLVFDGNIHSLGGAFWFDERYNRSVGVHSGAIIEALKNVYGADALLKEITLAR